MLHAFLVNPKAGESGGADRAVPVIRAECEKLGLDYAVTLTASADEAAQLVQSYASGGEEVRLYACGGDGTLNQIVQAAAGHDNLAVTNLPLGTGNDFLKMFGPTYQEAFWDIPALAEGPQAAMDLIDCNGHLGLDIVCAGVDARVAKDVHNFPSRWGKGAYVLALLRNVALHGIARPMKVTMGGQTWDEPISLVCVCNGRYYGGGFMPVGEAMPDDGVLDTLLVKKVGRLAFARLVGDYSKGRYAKYPHLITPYHGPEPIILEAETPITLCVDGEILEDTRFVIGLADKKVNFFWPGQVHYRQEVAAELAAVGQTAQKLG